MPTPMPAPPSPDLSAARKPALLILAAGHSRRMRGGDKLLEPVDGTAQLRRICSAALATGCRVMLALPPGPGPRADVTADLAVERLEVSDRDEGIAASLRAGARRAALAGEALMIVPGDMPWLEAQDLTRLSALHLQKPQAILQGCSAGRPGHPVLFPADLLPELLQLSGDSGAKPVLRRHKARLIRLDLPEAHATFDADTPEDWQAFRAARGEAPLNQP